MRQIKFRAWNVKNKCWFKRDIGVVTFDGHYDFSSNDNIIMQFTGLKDKNGKEIYEGDIISGYGVVEIGVYEMFSDKSGFPTWIAKRKKSSWVLVCNNEYKCREEVIGNIHENPELLN